MVTTTISLDERTHRRLRRMALDRGMTFRDLIREAITGHLAQGAKGGRRDG